MEQIAVVASVALNIYALIHLVAIIFSWIHADPNSQLVLTIRKITVPMWRKVESFLPYLWKNLSAFISILLIYWAERVIPAVIRYLGNLLDGKIEMDSFLELSGKVIAISSIITIQSVLFFVMLACIVWFIITIVSAPINNPLTQAVFSLVDPIISPVQKWLPRSKIDISPLIVALLAWLVSNMCDRLIPLVQSL